MGIAQSGWDNVAVNIDGDYNTVTISRGAVELVLFQRHLRRREVRTDLDLLHPEARTAVPLVGRGEDLAALRAWLDAPRLVAARCVIGQGGSGKTRLAIELCERAEAAGWHAGFVTYDELTRFSAQQNLASWRWPGSTLLVIDYAATGAVVIRRWLEQLSRLDPAKAPPDRRLRLLLLERHADAGHGWWAELTRAGTMGTSGVRDLLDPDAEPVRLYPLGSIRHRRILLRRVMEEANRLRPTAGPTWPPAPGVDPDFDRELGNDARNNEPLYLMMAGLAAVQHGLPHLLTLERTDLACRLAEGEVERIRRLAEARGLDGPFLAHMAVVATLADGLEFDRLTDAVGRERQALGVDLPGGPAKVVSALAAAMPSLLRHHVEAVRPDLIGEAVVLHVLDAGRYTPTQQSALVERSWRLAPEKTIASVIRTAQDFAGDEPEHASLLWLDRLIEVAPTLDALSGIARAMPETTVALRERAAAVQARVVDEVRSLADGSEEAKSSIAGALDKLAIRLSYLGRREEALAAAREAMETHRALAVARPGAFGPGFGRSIHVFRHALSELGRREEALTWAQLAAELYRGLAAVDPDMFRPDLAVSLNNLTVTLHALGRREEALAAAREVVDLRRATAAARPDAFLPDLAGSLNNLAAALHELGRREDALAAQQEASGLYRALAAARPDAFRPYLAGSLNNLASRLRDLDRRKEALEAAQEAVDLRRALTAARPDAFLPDLAMSLSVLAKCFEAVGRVPEAVQHGRESVAALAPMFERYPEALAARILSYARDYILRAKASGIEPDQELLGPIAERLAAMMGDSGGEEERG